MDFEIHLRSLRGHKGVKGQIYKDAPIELKFQYNDPYDILSILKIFCNSFEVIKGSQSGQRSNFQKCSDWSSHNFVSILAYQIEHGQLLDGRRH